MIEPNVFKSFAQGVEEQIRTEEGSLNVDPMSEHRRAGLHAIAPGSRPPRDGYSRTSEKKTRSTA